MAVALRHPQAFQTHNEITSLCFVSKHLLQKFFKGMMGWDGRVGGMEGWGGSRNISSVWECVMSKSVRGTKPGAEGKYPYIVMATAYS